MAFKNNVDTNTRPTFKQLRQESGENVPVHSLAFLDREGRLHIVVHGNESKVEVEKHRLAKKEVDEGELSSDGIYIHVGNSPYTDKICPCKFTPNQNCE